MWKYVLAWFIGFTMGGMTVLEMYFRLEKKRLLRKVRNKI